MMATAPRQFVNRGSVLAFGFIIRWNIIGMDEARQRVLELWRPGVQVKTAHDAFIVLLPEPVRVLAEEAIGEPLVRSHDVFAALPLEAGKLEESHSLGGALLFAKAGEIKSVTVAELPNEDVAGWIDTSTVTIADVTSLGDPPVKLVFQSVQFDPRCDLADIPPASAELLQLLSDARTGKQTPPPSPTFFSLLRAGFLRLANSFRRRPAQAASSPNALQRPTGAAAKKPSRLSSWLSDAALRVMDLTRLSEFINRQRARYLYRMVKMMQSGDLQEGLRYAIPLKDVNEVVKHTRLSFRLPQPRASLAIRPHRTAASSSWQMGGDIFAYLRTLYRESFVRLDAQGRIEEAVFVLTELLAEHAEAVSYLEKHGKFALAAEIAEARQLDAAMVIRLWWLAGDKRRAISVACRTGQFEAAVRRLAPTHPEESDKLRTLWAERLASEGKYVHAAEAIWPLKEARYLAWQWFNQAVDLGGNGAAVALAKGAARFPEKFDELSPRIKGLLADESRECAEDRWAFANTLHFEPTSPESESLARLAARCVVRDHQQGMLALQPYQLRGLLEYSADAALRTDVPSLNSLQHITPETPSPSVIEIAAQDIGAHYIKDVALLPGGRLLLALGEAGLRLLSREGKTIAIMDQPAEKLVISEDGARAIGIASRGSVSRLTRIDPLARTASYWCDANITAFTPTFNGSVWCVAYDKDVFLIDTLSRKFEPLWKIPDLDGPIRAMQRRRTENRLYVVTENPDGFIFWSYEQASCVLRAKDQVPSPFDPRAKEGLEEDENVAFARAAVFITEYGMVLEQTNTWWFRGGNSTWYSQRISLHSRPHMRLALADEIAGGSLVHAAGSGDRVAIPVFKEDGIHVFLFEISSQKCRLLIRLKGVKDVALRFADNILLCADDQGRLLALNLETNHLLRNLRV
jgi:MoxR-vWA-beta-propeller ternary system protein